MTSLEAAYLAQNLRALTETNADLAGLLHEMSADAPVPTDEPARAASANVVDFQPKPGAGGMGPPVFVLGCGLGRRLTALLADRLANRSRQPVVVVEPDPAKLRAAMAAADWRPVITDPRVRWAVGPDSYTACLAAFDNDPGFSFQNAQFVCGHADIQHALAPGAAPSHWSRFVAQAREEIDEYQKRLHDSVHQFLQWREGRPHLSELPPDQVRVFARTDRNTTALKYITADLLEAAQRAGHTTHVLEEDYLNDPFLGPRRMRAILDFQPDLVVNLIQTGRQAFSTLRDQAFTGIPFAVYYSSDPRRYDLAPERFSPDDHVFIADPEWEERFGRIGRPIHHLPLATSLHLKTPAPDADRWSCEVAMVSNLTGPEYVLPALTARQRHRLLELAEPVADDPEADADDVLGGLSAAETAIASPEALAAALEVAATWHLRRQAAVLLAEADFDFRVYGNEEWRSALAGTAAADCYHGPLDYETEVPAVYRQARVIVNVGSRSASSALNMRAYDVPAVGGCLITNDGPAIREAFTPGEEVVVYARVEELPRLVGELLGDAAKRDAIAEAGRARVLREHTYDRRWESILDVCKGR
ncbi:MAG: glycosyltransferase [Phycisphaerales bacterium]|nr:MAG: glycosyltransferase [Phycisphaerales bacterium]